MATLEQVCQHGIVPVIVIRRAGDAALIGQALAEGGLPVAEVTLRTPLALDAISEMSERGGMIVGAGTVVSATQVDDAVARGASFIVSPGFSLDVVERAAYHGVPVLPGAVTATEIMAAIAAGVEVVKFFPAAASGGLPVLSALSEPFGGVGFVPTGGIGLATFGPWLEHKAVRAVGGSWLTPDDLVHAGDRDALTAIIAESATIAKGIIHAHS